MKPILILIFGVALLAQSDPSTPSKPTYNRHIAPILYNRCVSCHSKGQVAPMPFTTYREVHPWAKGIKDRAMTGTMPPRPIDAKHDNKLTRREIDIIAAWVDSGAPEGDARDLPTMALRF